MAKGRGREGVYVDKPRADAYLAMIILTFVAQLIACFILYIEYSSLKG